MYLLSNTHADAIIMLCYTCCFNCAVLWAMLSNAKIGLTFWYISTVVTHLERVLLSSDTTGGFAIALTEKSDRIKVRLFFREIWIQPNPQVIAIQYRNHYITVTPIRRLHRLKSTDIIIYLREGSKCFTAAIMNIRV